MTTIKPANSTAKNRLLFLFFSLPFLLSKVFILNTVKEGEGQECCTGKKNTPGFWKGAKAGSPVVLIPASNLGWRVFNAESW
jgi:hypothetical protein